MGCGEPELQVPSLYPVGGGALGIWGTKGCMERCIPWGWGQQVGCCRNEDKGDGDSDPLGWSMVRLCLGHRMEFSELLHEVRNCIRCLRFL